MAQNTNSACPACQCGGDSPLSITASVIGILTFALAAWLSVVYYYRSFRDFSQEMHEMQHRVQLAFEEAQGLRRRYMEQQSRVMTSSTATTTTPTPPPTTHDFWATGRGAEPVGAARYGHPLIDQVWDRAEREMVRAAKFVNKRVPGADTTVLGGWRSRAAWSMERKRAVDTVEKLECTVDNVKGIVTDVTGQIPTDTDFRIMQMGADIAELRRQNEDVAGLMKQILCTLSLPDTRSNRPRGAREESQEDDAMSVEALSSLASSSS